MPLRSLLVGSGDTSRSTDLALLVLRIVFGLTLAFGHGLGKLPPSEGFVDGTAAMGFPLPTLFAWAAALSEFAGGVLLALGLLTRPAALFVAITMAVAFVVRHQAAVTGPESGEMALLYLAASVALLLAGAGRYALDAILWRRTATL